MKRADSVQISEIIHVGYRLTPSDVHLLRAVSWAQLEKMVCDWRSRGEPDPELVSLNVAASELGVPYTVLSNIAGYSGRIPTVRYKSTRMIPRNKLPEVLDFLKGYTERAYATGRLKKKEYLRRKAFWSQMNAA